MCVNSVKVIWQKRKKNVLCSTCEMFKNFVRVVFLKRIFFNDHTHLHLCTHTHNFTYHVEKINSFFHSLFAAAVSY